MLLEPAKTVAKDPAVAISLKILQKLNEGFSGTYCARFWDDTDWKFGEGTPGFTLVLKHPGALRAMFLHARNPAIGFGEAYIFGDFDVEGDILAFSEWVSHLNHVDDPLSLWYRLSVARMLLKLPKSTARRDEAIAGRPTKGDHRVAADREAISYTYDLPGEVYELFLDRHLQYTCGYFAEPGDDLETAQLRKMELICRKLRLKPGERLADFGCGWGGLLIYAAKQFGIDGTGFTLSKVQAEYANRAIAAAGVQDRVRVELCDFREFQPKVLFDKATSVGVGEHIGHKNLSLFFGKVYECLRPGGLYLHHTINLAPHRKRPPWTAFSHKYVFPNGEMQNIVFVLDVGSGAGFEIRDVENLREHYVPTLQAWVRKLEANRDRVRELAGDVRYRIFQLYMSGATTGFKKGIYNLTQTLFAKLNGDQAEVPPSRADLYSNSR